METAAPPRSPAFRKKRARAHGVVLFEGTIRPDSRFREGKTFALKANGNSVDQIDRRRKGFYFVIARRRAQNIEREIDFGGYDYRTFFQYSFFSCL